MKFLEFACPRCDQAFQVAESDVGQIVQCPSCAQAVEIPLDQIETNGPRTTRPLEVPEISSRPSPKPNRQPESSDSQPHVAPENTDSTPNEQRAIDDLLPPRFDVVDPKRSGSRRQDDHRVVLPDGDGGTALLDKRILRVRNDGQDVSLVAMSTKQRSRRRLIQNVIAIVIGVVIMAIAFFLLT